MRKFSIAVLTVVGLLLTNLSWAQQRPSNEARGRIAGRIVAADNGEPLEGATVAVRIPSDSTLVTGGIADSTGAFSIGNVPTGTYMVRISFVGFATKRITDVRLSRSRPARDLGTIRLAESTAEMDEVEVSAERAPVEMKIDRTVYNTSKQLVTAGGSARDVLQDLPSIEVDLDGSISYRGSESVVIHINGKPSSLSGEALVSFLQSLPAESVERVEVIPNPSAKYEPEGMAGIINVVLKKNTSAGWSGGITVGGGTNSSYNASGNLGYQSGPWRVFSTYGFRYGTRDASSYRLRRNLMQDPITILDQSSAEDNTRRSHTLSSQMEYQMSEATSFLLESTLSLRSGTEDGRTNYTERAGEETLLDRYARLTETDETDQGFDARLSFQHNFAPESRASAGSQTRSQEGRSGGRGYRGRRSEGGGRSNTMEHGLSAELRYERDLEDEGGMYTQRSLAAGDLGDVRSREREDLSEQEQEASLEVDYTRPLGRFDLETGYKGSLERLDSDQRFEVLDAGTGIYQTEDVSAFEFDEQIHAGYGILRTELGRFGLEAGLRAEQALTTFALDATGEAFDNNYFSLFPSAFLTYKPSEARQMRLSYSKRVDRPNQWQLNPVDDNQNPNFRFIGNPTLDPEYIHSFELSFVQHWNALSITTSPFFRRTVNEIEFREKLSPEGVTTVTFENFASSNSYGIEFITSLQMQDWVRGNVTLNAHRVVTDASNVDTDLSNDAIAYSARANLTFTLASGLDLQLSQFYRAPMDIAGGRMDRRMRSDIALQKEFFDGNASLSLRASDVFDTMGFEVWRSTDTFYTENHRNWNARQIMVTFSYIFGNSSNRRRGNRGGGPSGDFEGGEGYQQ